MTNFTLVLLQQDCFQDITIHKIHLVFHLHGSYPEIEPQTKQILLLKINRSIYEIAQVYTQRQMNNAWSKTISSSYWFVFYCYCYCCFCFFCLFIYFRFIQTLWDNFYPSLDQRCALILALLFLMSLYYIYIDYEQSNALPYTLPLYEQSKVSTYFAFLNALCLSFKCFGQHIYYHILRWTILRCTKLAAFAPCTLVKFILYKLHLRGKIAMASQSPVWTKYSFRLNCTFKTFDTSLLTVSKLASNVGTQSAYLIHIRLILTYDDCFHNNRSDNPQIKQDNTIEVCN